MAVNNTQKKERRILIHSLIGLAIMIGFRFLPLNLPEITPTGMEVMGIFLGTLYLWTFVDPLWASIISIAMVGFSSYAPMPQVLKECFGNPTLLQSFYMMAMAGALVCYNVTAYIGRFFITRKFTNGKPWLMTFVICMGAFCIAAFVNCFTGIFLFWPVMYDVFKEIGYKPGDAYPRVVLTLIVISALIGFPVAPYAQNGLALLKNFYTLTESLPGGPIEVNNAAYLVSSLTYGVLAIAACVLFAKFVFRPDVEKLKKFDIESLNKTPLPPMSKQQRILSAGFVSLVLLMLIPSIVKTVPFINYLGTATTGMGFFILGILAAIRIDGKPVVNVGEVLSKNMSWSSYYIIAAAIFLGSVLTSQNTGVSEMLKVLLSPIFGGMSPIVFTIAILLIAGVLTNLCNSLVIGMIMQPIIVTYMLETGANPRPIVTVMILFVLMSAAITPAASPFAALLHSNKEWIETKYVYRYTLPLVLIEFLIGVIVIVPLTNMLMP